MHNHCPNCRHSWETSDAAMFCESCGTPMNRGHSTWDLSAKSREMAEQLGAYQPLQPTVSCEHLKVEYRENLYFLAGAQIPFELQITPLCAEVQGVFVWFSPQIVGQQNVVHDIPVNVQIETNRSIRLQIPYIPGNKVFGIVPFHFYFGCVLKHGMKYYQMTVNHQVFRRNQSVKSVVNQIKIEASQAGTINAGLNDLMRSVNPRTANELLEQLNKSARHLTVQKLEETRWRPEHGSVQGNLHECDRLTLSIGGHLYQIIGKNGVKLGRDSEQVDLIIADMLSAASQKEHPNNTVSRVCAEILYCGENVLFFDRSRHGTFINGIKPRSEGIPVANEAVIEFGDIHWRMVIQHCEGKPAEPICKACLGHGVKSLTFVREDRVPESYLLVWECCELGRLDQRLAGFRVYRRNGGFFLRTPDGLFQYLAPGRAITHKAIVFNVCQFKQFGF